MYIVTQGNNFPRSETMGPKILAERELHSVRLGGKNDENCDQASLYKLPWRERKPMGDFQWLVEIII
jgi:hypothetical protein